MKVYVINLDRRPDRLEHFTSKNKEFYDQCHRISAIDGSKLNYQYLRGNNFDTNKNWRDPILDRTLTSGEIGCFLSHYHIWKMIKETGEPAMILEDDILLKTHVSNIFPLLGDSDLLYLTFNEMNQSGQRRVTDTIVKPCYPYWTTGYILSPNGADKLVNEYIENNIIPVDEYLPLMTDKIEIIGCDPPLAEPTPRSVLSTDVDTNSNSDYFIDFNTHVLTCGDDDSKMTMLSESTNRHRITVNNVLNGKWIGGTMEGPGGGQKLVDLLQYINDNNLPDHDVILFTDAFDVFFHRDLDNIIGRYLEFNTEVVFAAEQYLWPDESLLFPTTHTKYRYLNSGCFIGRVGEIKGLLSRPIKSEEDDQLYLQQQFLTQKFDVVLDTEGYIFQTNEEECVVVKDMIFNPITKCYSCIYHGNGGSEAKLKLCELYNNLYRTPIYSTSLDYEVIGDNMLLIDFMSPSQCEEWIRLSEDHGNWKPDSFDTFPSHDIHLKTLGLWDMVEWHWRNHIAPITDKYWPPSVHYHLRKAFTMKYSNDTQTNLGLHNDSSLITGSVRLNDDYEGATLIFPRQNITNKDIPIGKMILFPGQVTHGHYVENLQSGVKYSATFWTARYEGDLLEPEV